MMQVDQRDAIDLRLCAKRSATFTVSVFST
jgi:hypothetical protein